MRSLRRRVKKGKSPQCCLPLSESSVEEEHGVSCDTGDDDIPWWVWLALMLHVRNLLAADWLRGPVEALWRG